MRDKLRLGYSEDYPVGGSDARRPDSLWRRFLVWVGWPWICFVLLGLAVAGLGDDCVNSRDAWVDRKTMVLCGSLEQIGERTIFTYPKKGRRQKITYLTTAYLRGIVEDTYDAAVLNPSWGSREVVAAKLLASIFNESGFYRWAYNDRLNKNGSTDVGLLQINSVHWREPHEEPTWRLFCRQQGIDPDLKNIWVPRINIMFGAYINERRLLSGRGPYRFEKRKNGRILYRNLVTDTLTASR